MGAPALLGVSLLTTIAGGVAQAAGAKQQATAQAQAYRYQAGIADVNAKLAAQNADWSRAAGETDAMQLGLKERVVQGKIRAAQGASGLDVNSGTALDVQDSAKKVSDIDVAQSRTNAARRAYGYEVEAYNATAQGKLYQASASNAEQAGKINVLSSFLGTASSVSNKWLQAKQYGIQGT